MPELYELREDFKQGKIADNALPADPLHLFENWMDLAVEHGLADANAMTLATAPKNGIPSARIVLLKYFDKEGFVFFTNYNSRKGEELEENPRASLLFYWSALQKQVRIEGTVCKTPTEISDLYFAKRPPESKIAACISSQSHEIENREILETTFEQYKNSNQKIERPANWGGFTLKPGYFEFWQGRPRRLHDRIAYTLKNGQWRKNRLAP